MADEALTPDYEAKKRTGFFTAPSGGKSMRRLLAFILVWASIAGSILGACKNLEWKSIATLSGIPLLGAVLLLFFTTWGDVEKIVKAAKGGSNDDERR